MAAKRTTKDGKSTPTRHKKGPVTVVVGSVTQPGPPKQPAAKNVTALSFTGTSLVDILVPGANRVQVRDAIIARKISGLQFRQMRSYLHLSIDTAAKLLDIAPRTVNRKEANREPLSIAEGDRAFRIARIADLAIELIGDREKALTWLGRTNAFFGGKKPLEMLDTEIGADLVAQSLHTIAYGGTA